MRIISGRARGTKLYTLEGYETTRPTLDRVKEALFSKINMELPESIVLDLFSGCGALGLESISRGAEKVYFCDKSPKAVDMIKKNLDKTKLKDKATILNNDYIDCIDKIKNIKFDIIFLDPPYKENFSKQAIKKISESKLLKNEGIIIVETDEPERDIKEIENINIDYKIYDLRKYGRASLIFLK